MAHSENIQTLPQPPSPRPAESPAAPAEAPSAGRAGFFWVPVVLLFGFLLASFPARNTDLWAHLAAGRDLAGGDLSAASNTWLYDLATYLLYQALGGPGLVLGKALLVVGVAGVVLRLSRAGPGWWVPAFCTGLALLAMSTRLLLQPTTVSYLFLALALLSLKFDEGPTEAPPALLPPWPLLLLFFAWANTDAWFVLGLAVAALVSLGQGLDGPAPHGGRARGLVRRAFFLAVLAAVCLLNPAHVHAFALPPELDWLGPGAAAPRLTSPFQPAYFIPSLGLSPAGLAYFPLLGLGLLSFLLNPPWVRGEGRWQWFLPWLGLAALSAVEARTVPFFAVVGGPVLAGNLQAFFARRPQAERPPGLAAHALAGALGLAFLLCAWPGWLQAPPHEPRRCTVIAPPSLKEGAEVVSRWHREGKLGPDSRGLHLSPDSAEAFAWFCPEEKPVLDPALAAALRGESKSEDPAGRMRAAGADHVLVYETDAGRRTAVLGRLFADPGQWPLLFLEGNLVIFGWRDPEKPGSDRFRGLELDLQRLAFRPPEEARAPATLPDEVRPGQNEPTGEIGKDGKSVMVPATLPDEVRPGQREWWEAFYKLAPPLPPDRDEALIHLIHVDTAGEQTAQRHTDAWVAQQAAGLWGGLANLAGPAGAVDARLRLVLVRPLLPGEGGGGGPPVLDRMALGMYQGHVFRRDDVPPALLYLAIRAARRAVAVNPDDARAHFALGESYLRLLYSTRERAWGRRFVELAELRRAQASAALNRAIDLKPDYALAHYRLGILYRDMGYLDLALHHLRTHLDLSAREGPPPGVSAEQFLAGQDLSRKQLEGLAADVKEREDRYAADSAGKPVIDRAELARAQGLAGKARDLLLQSDVAAFGDRGMELELELLLNTGRPADVWGWTDPEHQAALGPALYHWLRARAFAATGRYAQAAEECHQQGLGLSGNSPATQEVRGGIALLIAQAVLARNTEQAVLRGRILELSQNLKRMADWTVLRGLILLEQGDVEEARASFRDALALWGDEPTAASGAGLDFYARPVAQQCLEWLE